MQENNKKNLQSTTFPPQNLSDLMDIPLSTSKTSFKAIQIAFFSLHIPGTMPQFIISFVNYL